MAVVPIKYVVEVDTSSGKVRIDGVTKGFVEADLAAKKLNATLKQTNTALAKGTDKTGLAGAAVVELGRTISDSNYGLTAMANNISQLTTLFVTLIATTGGLKKAMLALKQAFLGPLGLIVIFQIAVAVMEGIAIRAKAAKSEINKLNQSLTTGFFNLIDTKARVELLEDVNTSLDDQRQILEDLKNKGYDPAKQSIDEFIKSQERLIILTASKEALTLLLKDIIKERLEIFTKMKEEATAMLKLQDVSGTTVDGISRAIIDGLQEDLAENEDKMSSAISQYKSIIDKILKETFGKDAPANRGADQRGSPLMFLGGIVDKATFDLALPEIEGLIKYQAEKVAELEAAELSRLATLRADANLFALSLADDFGLQMVSLLDERYNRELVIEQNATNDKNNELRNRLRNENLSAEERKRIQLKISDNDEKLRLAQQKIAEKQFNFNKGASIVEATISTYLAATKALAAFGGAPYGLPAMFATIAVGLAQVATIASTKFQTSAGSAPSAGDLGVTQGGDTVNSQPPNFNIVGDTGINQLRDTILGVANRPIKTYVTGKDIRTMEELDRNIVRGSTIGG